jgi:hypothetical protein
MDRGMAPTTRNAESSETVVVRTGRTQGAIEIQFVVEPHGAAGGSVGLGPFLGGTTRQNLHLRVLVERDSSQFAVGLF